MTKLAISQDHSQEIKITSPVLSEFSEQGYMAFVMPTELTLENNPMPLDKRVKIKEVPARLIAVLSFSGSWTKAHFAEKTKALLQELADAKIKTIGNIFTMLHNPPFTLTFLRRNEVAIEVKR